MRNTYAMNPAIMAMNMPVNMYCSAITLWSVDHRYLMNQLDSACPWGACGWASTCAISAMVVFPSVRDAGRGRGGGFGGRGGGGRHGVLFDPGGVLFRALDHDAG